MAIHKDAMGHKYVLGHGSEKYYITDVGSIDAHLRKLTAENKKTGDPAWNALLDARRELEASDAS